MSEVSTCVKQHWELKKKPLGFRKKNLEVIFWRKAIITKMNSNYAWTPQLLDMEVDFEIAQLGPNFQNTKTILELIVLNHISVWSKNSDQDLSFEGLNIFVGHLKVYFLELLT